MQTAHANKTYQTPGRKTGRIMRDLLPAMADACRITRIDAACAERLSAQMDFGLLINAIVAGLSARRLLRRRDRRHLDLVRHARHRQHRASRLHHPRLLHRLHRQHDATASIRSSSASSCCRRSMLLGAAIYQVYYVVVREARPGVAARARLLLRPAVRHRGRADPGVRRRLPLRRGVLYRANLHIGAHRNCRCACWCRACVALADVRALADCSCRAASSAARSWRWRRIRWRCS